jgi:hypothetical protein
MPEYLHDEREYMSRPEAAIVPYTVACAMWMNQVTFAFAVGSPHPGRDLLVPLLQRELLPLTAEDQARGLIPSGSANSRAPRCAGPGVGDELGNDSEFFKSVKIFFREDIQGDVEMSPLEPVAPTCFWHLRQAL